MTTSEKPFLPIDLNLLCEIIDKSPDIVFSIDTDGKIQYVNSSFCQILGYSKEEAIGKNIKEIAVEKSIYDACMLSVKETGKCIDQETIFRTKDNRIIHVIKNVNALYNENGEISSIIVNARDLTHIDKLNKELMELKEHLEDRLRVIQEVFLNINEAVAVIDKDGFYIEQNRAHEKLLGYTIEELKGNTPLIHMKKADYERVLDEVIHKGLFVGEVSIKTKNNQIKDIELIVLPVKDRSGNITHYIGIKRDITQKKESLYKDFLTNLPNRIKLIEDINKTFHPKLILINIDAFKEINDVYGFRIGDELLKKMGERLSDFLKPHKFTIYRAGSDEYAILLNRYISQKDLEILVNNMIWTVQSKPFYIQDYEISVDITVGIAIPKDFDEKSVLEKADMALKYAKENRKPYFIYTEDIEIHRRFQENLKWVKILKNAIEHKKFVTFYQPIFDNKTLKPRKYEALIRIKDGDTYISPVHFLDIAKKAKLYHYITQEVISKAFEISRKHNIDISINLSIKDILNESITSQIFDQLKKNTANVTFELLESEGIQNFEEVIAFIKEVKSYGVKIAIDDFGSGYSNFEYLLKMKVDYLKIDSSLIKEIHLKNESRAIVETIVSFSKKLGIQTIAEFVHCKEVFDTVKSIGIDYSQGFYLGEPKANIVI